MGANGLICSSEFLLAMVILRRSRRRRRKRKKSIHTSAGRAKIVWWQQIMRWIGYPVILIRYFDFLSDAVRENLCRWWSMRFSSEKKQREQLSPDTYQSKGRVIPYMRLESPARETTTRTNVMWQSLKSFSTLLVRFRLWIRTIVDIAEHTSAIEKHRLRVHRYELSGVDLTIGETFDADRFENAHQENSSPLKWTHNEFRHHIEDEWVSDDDIKRKRNTSKGSSAVRIENN